MVLSWIAIVVSLFFISLILIYISSDKVKSIKLSDSKIIITGGSDGLGLEISKLLVKSGSHLVIISRNEKKLKNTMEILLPLKKDVCYNYFLIDRILKIIQRIKN